VSEDVWSAQDTHPDDIDAALRELLRRRHAEHPSLAPARVLNLVVVVDRSWKGEVANRLERVGRYHASRTILCAVEEGRKTLDATALMTFDETQGVKVMREQVEIDLGGSHLGRLNAVIDPVVKEELPLMLWCPHGHQEAIDSLREMTDVILLDSDQRDEADAALAQADDLLRSAYVVDLAWLRTTPWRERLAASFDVAERLPLLPRIDSLEIRFRADSIASALLLAGWLASRLGWQLCPLQEKGGSLAATAQRPGRAGAGGDAEVQIALQATEQEAPGLAGVTVSCDDGTLELSLERSRGGLCARERSGEGEERTWQVLGASRGEGGILGEGVRQALLRDPTYGPALRATRSFWGQG
jgi:glucose-6-phosphate dehydrogenase assembly protein OpcA